MKKQNYFLLFFTIACVMRVSAQIPKYDHVVIVIYENHSYSAIIGKPSVAPYINQLADSGALFTSSTAIIHPSQPNYMTIFSGTNLLGNQLVLDDDVPKNLPFKEPNLGASLISRGFTFKGYSEDLPWPGFSGPNVGLQYARKHAPWANWQNSSVNGFDSTLHQPFTAFPTDFNQLPTVSFVIPNEDNDMHNGTIAQGDAWLKNNIKAYADWAKTHNSLLIFTFDECGNDFPNPDVLTNRIPTLFYGQWVKIGKYSEKINHYTILRTLEDMYSLPYCTNNDKKETPIIDSWETVTTGQQDITASKGKVTVFPNPFSESTTIKIQPDYSLSPGEHFFFSVYDILGNELMRQAVDKDVFILNKNQIPAGIYFFKVSAGEKAIETGKLMVE